MPAVSGGRPTTDLPMGGLTFANPAFAVLRPLGAAIPIIAHLITGRSSCRCRSRRCGSVLLVRAASFRRSRSATCCCCCATAIVWRWRWRYAPRLSDRRRRGGVNGRSFSSTTPSMSYRRRGDRPGAPHFEDHSGRCRQRLAKFHLVSLDRLGGAAFRSRERFGAFESAAVSYAVPGPASAVARASRCWRAAFGARSSSSDFADRAAGPADRRGLGVRVLLEAVTAGEREPPDRRAGAVAHGFWRWRGLSACDRGSGHSHSSGRLSFRRGASWPTGSLWTPAGERRTFESTVPPDSPGPGTSARAGGGPVRGRHCFTTVVAASRRAFNCWSAVGGGRESLRAARGDRSRRVAWPRRLVVSSSEFEPDALDPRTVRLRCW